MTDSASCRMLQFYIAAVHSHENQLARKDSLCWWQGRGRCHGVVQLRSSVTEGRTHITDGRGRRGVMHPPCGDADADWQSGSLT